MATKYKLPPLLSISDAPPPRSSSDGGATARAGQGDGSVLSAVMSPRVNSTTANGTIASPKHGSLTPGSPRTPSSRFEDPMLTWRSRSITAPAATGEAHSPASGIPLTSSPSFRSPVSGQLSHVRSARNSLGGNSYLHSPHGDGITSASSSRRQSMSGGMTPPTDGAPPWAMRASLNGSEFEDDDEASTSYSNSERTSPSNPNSLLLAGTGALPSGASATSAGGGSTGAGSSGDPMSDLVGRRHSYQPLQRPDSISGPSMLFSGRQAMSMRFTDEDDFMKRLQQHRSSWRHKPGEGLQNKTHEALKQLLGEMKSTSFRDRRVSSGGGASSALLGGSSSFKHTNHTFSAQALQPQAAAVHVAAAPGDATTTVAAAATAAAGGGGGNGGGHVGGGSGTGISQPLPSRLGLGFSCSLDEASHTLGGGIVIGTAPAGVGGAAGDSGLPRRPPLAPQRGQALHQSYDF